MQIRHRHPGFSLIEILLVVMLMGILAGVVIPHFQPNTVEQLESAGQIISTELAYARNLAVSNSDKYSLTFGVSDAKIILKHSGANTLLDVLPTSPFADSSSTSDKQITSLDDIPRIGSSVRFTAILADDNNVSTIEFNPLGSTTRPEVTVIWLESGEGSSKRFLPLLVNPTTGLATLGAVQASSPLSSTP